MTQSSKNFRCESSQLLQALTDAHQWAFKEVLQVNAAQPSARDTVHRCAPISLHARLLADVRAHCLISADNCLSSSGVCKADEACTSACHATFRVIPSILWPAASRNGREWEKLPRRKGGAASIVSDEEICRNR